MDAVLLRDRIIKKYNNQSVFAREVKWSDSKVSSMLRGKYVPNVDEAAVICEALEMPENVYRDIFLLQ